MHKIKQLMLFHPMKFVCRSFEQFAKDIGVEVYSLEKMQEFAYILEELQPAIIFFHEAVFNKQEDFILKELEKSKFTPARLVIISSSENLQIDGFRTLVEPYDLGQLEKIIDGLLAEHH